MLRSFHFSNGGTDPSAAENAGRIFAGTDSEMTKKKGNAGVDRWPLRQRPGFLVRRLHQIHVALFQESCSKFEITPLQYSLLSALAARGLVDQTTLAAEVALDRTTTTGALKRLEARGFVQRAIRREDRRARACQLTASGAVLLKKMEGAARAAHRDTLACLSKSDQKRFVALMQRVIAAHAFRT
jgi:MarR family transcriptional regulator, lower aerobic nicotinate degradation pathway regulator